jgi:hypothetical protein
MIKLLAIILLLSLPISITFKHAEGHFMGTGVFMENYYIVFTTIPDFPKPNEPIALAFTIADARTLAHVSDADVVIKIKQGENLISTLEEEYSGYDMFVAYTFQDEGQYKVVLEINVPNGGQVVAAEFDVPVQENPAQTFKPVGAIVTGTPSGNVVIQPNHFFEVGVLMDAGGTLSYSYTADTAVFFNLHSHDGASITDYLAAEVKERSASFTAPASGNYYFLWENVGSEEVKMNYDISLALLTRTIEYEDQGYEITLASNSRIEDVRFDQPMKQILMKVTTPFLTPGFLNITIPKALLDGSLDVKGGSAQFVVVEGGPESILLINTGVGTHDIAIVGTTVVPEIPYPVILLSFSILILVILIRNTDLVKSISWLRLKSYDIRPEGNKAMFRINFGSHSCIRHALDSFEMNKKRG